MDKETRQRLENRAIAIIIIVLLVFFFSALGENKVQRSDPNYQSVGRGY